MLTWAFSWYQQVLSPQAVAGRYVAPSALLVAIATRTVADGGRRPDSAGPTRRRVERRRQADTWRVPGFGRTGHWQIGATLLLIIISEHRVRIR